MAWQIEQRIKCDGCNHPLDETTNADNRHLWVADKRTCFACLAKGLRRDAVSNGPSHPEANRWYVERLET